MRRLLVLLVAAVPVVGSCAGDPTVEDPVAATSSASSTSSPIASPTTTTTPPSTSTSSAPETAAAPPPTTPPPVDTTVASEQEQHFVRLVDRRFSGVEVTDDGVPREIVEDTQLTVWFQRNGGRDGVVWNGGCNSSGGPVVVSSDRLDVTHDGASSAVGCSDEHHAQDDWFTDFLVSDPTWALDGGVLTLSSGATMVVLHEHR